MNKTVESMLEALLERFVLGPGSDYIIVRDSLGNDTFCEIDEELSSLVSDLQDILENGQILDEDYN